MKRIYVDNSSTSFPKAPGVSAAMADFLDNTGCNVNRGGYEAAYDTALAVLETRQLIAAMFHAKQDKNVIFTPSVTYSLNMIIKGFLKPGDHVIVTSLEHNAVMRPLNQMVNSGIVYNKVECDANGMLNPLDLIPLITSRTKAVIMTHASNVCGTVLPIYDVAAICKKHGIKLIVDAAQTAGLLDLDMQYIDALAFTGHKNLLAAQGTGGFIVSEEIARSMDALIAGGTGSVSHEEIQPDYLPDKFEAGTMNIPGILGLRAALRYLNEKGINNILRKELSLTEIFLEGLHGLPEVHIIGNKSLENNVPVVSIDFRNRDNSLIQALLDSNYGIMTRCGLHCSPSAHKTLQTYPQGTIRFSFGHFNTEEEINLILQALKEILKGDT